MKRVPQIFISYAHADEDKAKKLYQQLKLAEFRPWMDREDIRPGEAWETAISKAIRESEFFLACLSTNSIGRRGWVQKELKEALKIWEQKLEDDIYLIPARFEECDVPETLRRFQWVDLFRPNGWAQLVNAIHAGLGRYEAIPETPSAVREHRPYEVSDFVNRISELNLVATIVQTVRDGHPSQSIIEFRGVSGVGKSWLLDHIHNQYVFKSDSNSSSLATLSILLDLQKLSQRERPMIDIVREMAKEIHAQVGNLVPRELASELNGIAETSNRVTEKELPARFLRVSKYLDESLIQVLLFDSVTLALGDLFEQIERDLLEPILMNRRAVIVTASRAPIYWKRFECRRRVIDKEVLPFDKQAMREQLDKWGIPDLTEAVYTYSFGYPERTELLAETFRNSLVDSLHSMEQRLIEGIPSEAQTILGLITPLRRFRVESLAELARILLGDMHERKPTGYYLNVLRTLHETGLVEWRRDYRAYATNDLFRKIVNTRLRMTDHQRYITLHEASLRIYLEWISEYPRNSSEFIAEALFHLAILYKDTDKAKFLNGINRRLEDIGALPSEERKAIYSQLTDDRELAEALGVEQYSRILSTCQSGMND